ncbi:MAG: hypothetical protein ACRETD_10640, partial [Steroidobacteraceae bacterium]
MKLTQVLSAVVGALVLSALWALPSYAQEVQSGAEVIYETNHDTSPALADLATAAAEQPEQPAESAIILPVRRTSTTETAAGAAVSEVDAVVQQLSGPRVSATIGLNFDGLTNLDRAVPPDTNASVGATQVVETVNLHYQVFNKTTGASVLGPLAISGIWSGFNGTLCGKTSFSYSDPVVLYDKAAARWVISILAFNNRFTSSSECYAVSTTSDATGSYNRYEVPFGSNLPDYPKFAVWPDAYYATFNIFPSGGAFAGAEVCALNRAAMLAGSAMTAECFQRTTADASFLPADADGATAPAAGEPDFYVELSSQSRSLLNLFKFHSDFITPALATFTGPTTIAVAAYT